MVVIKTRSIGGRLIKRLEQELEPQGIALRNALKNPERLPDVNEEKITAMKEELDTLEKERLKIREFLKKHYPSLYQKYFQIKEILQNERVRTEAWIHNRPLFPKGKYFNK